MSVLCRNLPELKNGKNISQIVFLTGETISPRYIEDITWWREDINFMFEWQEQYLTSEILGSLRNQDDDAEDNVQ